MVPSGNPLLASNLAKLSSKSKRICKASKPKSLKKAETSESDDELIPLVQSQRLVNNPEIEEFEP